MDTKAFPPLQQETFARGILRRGLRHLLGLHFPNAKRALLQRAPGTARRYRDRALETVPLDAVVSGDLLLVAPGELVPVDGTVAAAVASL